MEPIRFPEHVKTVLSRLEAAGLAAYAVGGCVRDSLLGREPADWDVATAALPEEVMAVFGPDALPTGLRHGTVTVRTEVGGVEVTTFRSEGVYSDHRHPDAVAFVGSLSEDLSRRDFTVNAMAVGLDGTLIDLFGGQADLRGRIIRCVGDPERRFREDALRMLRALRFAARLGFAIEENTLRAIYENAPLAAALAPERVQAELCAMLPFPCAGSLGTLFSSGLMERWCRRGEVDFSPIEALPEGVPERLTALCALLGREALCQPEAFLSALRCSNALTLVCSVGAGAALAGLPSDRSGWKRLLHRIGPDAARRACAAALALTGKDPLPELEAVLRSGECWSLDALALKGADLLSLGYRGQAVGKMLEYLLKHVIEHPEDNKKSTLLAILTIDGA